MQSEIVPKLSAQRKSAATLPQQVGEEYNIGLLRGVN